MSKPFKRMKAQDVGSLDGLNLVDYVVEQKYDGMFIEIHVHENDDVELWSSTAKRISGNGSIWLWQAAWPGKCVVLGEIYQPGGASNDVIHQLANSGEKLRFAVFDVLIEGGVGIMQMPLAYRMGIRAGIVKNLGNQRIHEVEHASGMYEPPPLMEHFCIEALKLSEGVMLKELKSPYREGKRLRDWLKLKKTYTVDVVITDTESRPNRWRVRPGQKDTKGTVYMDGIETDPWKKGWVGLSYGYWDPARHMPVKVGSLGMTGPPEEMESHVGRVAEVKAYGMYPNGRIRHAQFLRWRTDKSPNECLKPEGR